MSRLTVSIVVSFSAVLWGPPAAAGSEPVPGPRTPHVDAECGSWAVHHVLECFGHRSDVASLVRELQPRPGQGMTIAEVEDALRVRGIGTRVVRVSGSARLAWAYPAVVLLKGRDSKIGHYVVWVPTTDSDSVRLYDGMAGVKEMPSADFAALRSGEVVLTFPQGSEPSGGAVEVDWGLLVGDVRFMAAVGLTVVAGTFLAAGRVTRRRPRAES